MFDGFYSFNKVNIVTPPNERHLLKIHNFTFKADKTPYIAQVEEYPGHIYIIKFFRKQDRKRKEKFSILTNEFRCTRIVSTCIRILIFILEKDELASFGFLGANTVADNYIEPKDNTQRFRIYKRAMENLVGNQVFEHSMDILHSTYLMVNRKNPSTDDFIERAKTIFEEIFPELEGE